MGQELNTLPGGNYGVCGQERHRVRPLQLPGQIELQALRGAVEGLAGVSGLSGHSGLSAGFGSFPKRVGGRHRCWCQDQGGWRTTRGYHYAITKLQ